MSWHGATDDELIAAAAQRAEALVRRAGREGSIAPRMMRLLRSPSGAAFARELADRVARPADARTAARALGSVGRELGVPSALGSFDRLALRLGTPLAEFAPQLVMPLVRGRIRAVTSDLMIGADDRSLTRHLARRAEEGVGVNLNLLGEAILGETEARRRITDVVALIERADVHAVSVKPSAIIANLEPLAFGCTRERLVAAMRPLLTAAAAKPSPCLVTFDMEEYRDLHVTLEAFKQVLDSEGFLFVGAGIVLQGYLPDALGALHDLAAWAADRHVAGGAPVKVRLVKGANLLMERVEAELHGWRPAPYASKAEVDANYKRLVEEALDPARLVGLRLGVASHNPFDLGWALELRSRSDHPDRVEIEMLEGMAPALSRAVRDEAPLVLYTPIVRSDDFTSALAYLARRVDEIAAPANVIGQLSEFAGGRNAFDQQRERFVAAVRARRDLAAGRRRVQDRRSPPVFAGGRFVNAADTDFSAAANRGWIAEALATAAVPKASLVRATSAIDAEVESARRAGAEWARRRPLERFDLLQRIGDEIEARRAEMIAAMVHEGGKTVAEADVEVSEAVDYARYYAEAILMLDSLEGVRPVPKGAILVVAPWNFPLAIPAGGVLAALAAGSAAVLKPAPQTRGTGELLGEIFAAAGVGEAVRVVHCAEDEVGRHLITHEGFGAVVLTGSIDTAEMFRKWKPSLQLHAETSGKNAIVITASADLDLAIRDLVRSAFGHAGQKCSAASLAIVEASVYDSRRFRNQLRDAVESLPVGSSDDLQTIVPPLIGPPSEALDRALRTLDDGEEWLVEPRCLDAAVNLWTPGVRIGVRCGSWFHQTECFGPVLGVVRARDLDDALTTQNAVAFGLTGGIHSLDPAEIVRWSEQVEVGNAYVNRGVTGAVVRRQPFGGWKASVVGPGAKTGGPNYVISLCDWRTERRARRNYHAPDAVQEVVDRARAELAADEVTALAQTASDFAYWWDLEFGQDHDPSQLVSESNVFRYRQLPRGVTLVVDAATARLDILRAEVAARLCGTPFAVVTVDELVEAHAVRVPDRLRLLAAERREQVFEWAAAHDVHVDVHPIVDHGRVELWRWLREQVVSETVHRHGTPVGRAVNRVRQAGPSSPR